MICRDKIVATHFSFLIPLFASLFFVPRRYGFFVFLAQVIYRTNSTDEEILVKKGGLNKFFILVSILEYMYLCIQCEREFTRYVRLMMLSCYNNVPHVTVGGGLQQRCAVSFICTYFVCTLFDA